MLQRLESFLSSSFFFQTILKNILTVISNFTVSFLTYKLLLLLIIHLDSQGFIIGILKMSREDLTQEKKELLIFIKII